MENSDYINLKNLTKSKVLGKVLFPSQTIKNRVTELGKVITEDYRDRDSDLLLISVLRGGVFFFTDILRSIDLELSIDFMGISTYQSTDLKSTGVVKITKGS